MHKGKNIYESVFENKFVDDLKYWIKADRKTALRVLELAEHIIRSPFEGIGKPEPLKYLGANVWSRRLTQEHRIVYIVKNKRIYFIQCKYHY